MYLLLKDIYTKLIINITFFVFVFVLENTLVKDKVKKSRWALRGSRSLLSLKYYSYIYNFRVDV